MFKSIFVEARQSGVETGDIPIVLPVNRTEQILEPDLEHAQVSVERYGLTAEVPLFDMDRQTWSLGVIVTGSPATMETMTLPQRWLYDYRDLAELMTTTISTACTTASIAPIDHPEVSFDPVTSLFTISTTAAFRAANALMVSRSPKFSLNTFPWVDAGNGLFALSTLEDEETQYAPTLELLSPISKIAITTELQVDFELMPSEDDPTAITKDDGQFLVDARYVQTNNESIVTMAFSVGDRVHARWHNLLNTYEIKKFRMMFHWVSHSGTFHELMLPPDANADIKIHFRYPVHV